MDAPAITLLAALIPVILFGSRRWALLAIAGGTLYLTQGEAVEVFGLSLFAVRFLELAGIGRVILRREFRFSNLNNIDKIFLVLYIYTTMVFAFRSSERLTFQIGSAFDATFSYFAFRGLISNLDDFQWFLRRFVILMVPYAALVLIERVTSQNPFAIVGANLWVANYREGIPRCTGSFRHAILMGSFGASFLPLYIGFLFEKRHRNIAIVGAAVCLGIVLLSNSGGPAAAVAIGLVGWGFWRFREKMRLVRIGMAFSLVFLAIFMKAPIWALPFKIGRLTGGGGYHRYYLLEKAIENFDKWWIAGMPMEETMDWFPYMLETTGGADITNEFISFGIRAGIIAIILFAFLLIKGFQVIGKELAYVRITTDRGRSDQFLIWGIGVMLMVHISNWFGVTYFDHLKYFWYLHLAMISMLADEARLSEAENDPASSLRLLDSSQTVKQSTRSLS